LLTIVFLHDLPSPDAAIDDKSRFAYRPLIIAHRGGATEFTENTIPAFQRAIRIGADGIETDLRITRDGVVVIYHDDEYGRVEGVGRRKPAQPISEMSYAELTARTLAPVGEDRGGSRVPTLDALLHEVKSGLLNIELKGGPHLDRLTEQTISSLKGYSGLDRVVLESPDLATARKFRLALGPQLKLHLNPGYDRSASYEESLKRVLAFRPHSISVSYRRANFEIIDQAHQAGVEVWVWTVDSPEIAQALALLGADAIKTDRPTLLLDLFRRRRESPTR
jgi:glycerophosphoryl diester phosphodiesterase